MSGPPIPYRAIVESSISPFVLVDGQGYVIWVGPAVGVLLGRDPESYVGVHFLEVLHPSSHEAAIAAFSDFVRPDRESADWIGPPMLLELVGADGPVTCEVSAVNGASIGLDGALLQVRRWRGTVLLYEAVDAIASGAPLDEVLSRLVDLAEHDMPAATIAVGIQWNGSRFGRVVGSPGAAALLAHEGPGSPWHDALTRGEASGEADLSSMDVRLAAATAAEGHRSGWAFPITVRPDAEPTASLVAWRRVEGPAAAHLVTTAVRVSRLVALTLEGERTRATWERAARTDALTGLSNRADLDDFKPVNDRYGHDAGDEVLAAVAGRIRGAVRPSDVVARWGGDEFVVLCAEPTTADDAVGIARRRIDAVNQPVTVGEAEVGLGVSVGVATAEASQSRRLVREADRALQQAKAAGKNQWRLVEVEPAAVP